MAGTQLPVEAAAAASSYLFWLVGYTVRDPHAAKSRNIYSLLLMTPSSAWHGRAGKSHSVVPAAAAASTAHPLWGTLPVSMSAAAARSVTKSEDRNPSKLVLGFCAMTQLQRLDAKLTSG